MVDGKIRNFQRRKYCLDCSPFGSGNTRNLETPKKSDSDRYYKWQKNARRERKEKLVEIMGGKCCKCGYNKCIKALEFHHKDPNTKNSKSRSFGDRGMLTKWKTLIEESKKCILVCANCHREIHN